MITMGIYETLAKELANFDLGVFDKAEQERRIGICQSCTNYSGDKKHTCSACECNINWKVMFAANSCPVGNWVSGNDDPSPVVTDPQHKTVTTT